MTSDEQSIRQWYDQWIEAVTVGNPELAKSLTAEDAVFLVPHAGIMDRETFVMAAAGTPDPTTDYDLKAGLKEFDVMGDFAWVISSFFLTSTVKETQEKSYMKGETLSVIRRHGDSWVTVREATTMAPTEGPESSS